MNQQALAEKEIHQMIDELETCLTAAKLTLEGIETASDQTIRDGLKGLSPYIGFKGKLVIGAGLLSSGALDDTRLFLDDFLSPVARLEAWGDAEFDSQRDAQLGQ